MSLSYKASYYPWITQHIDPKDIRSNIQILFDAVASELSRIIKEEVKIELLSALEVPQQINSIVKRNSQIALINPLGFVFANQQEKKVKAISFVEREIKGQLGLTYFSQVYTNKKSGIRTAAQMKKRSIGFGTAISTSNFLVLCYELYKQGLHPLNAFLKNEFIGGHNTVAKAVYDGTIDIGCGHDGVIKDLAAQYGYGDAEDKLVTLIQSEAITSDPVAVNIPDATEYTNLQKALELASKTPEGLKAIQNFWGKERYLLPPTAATNYDNLDTALKTLNMTATNILG